MGVPTTWYVGQTLCRVLFSSLLIELELDVELGGSLPSGCLERTCCVVGRFLFPGSFLKSADRTGAMVRV